MSGECDKCGEHSLECKCTPKAKPKPLSRRQQNGSKVCQGFFNAKIIPITTELNLQDLEKSGKNTLPDNTPA